MSHYTTLQTQMVSAPHLVRALADVGFAVVEVHETPQALYGFMGERREQGAEVIVRREHVGSASNDIGFLRGPEGVFTAIVSDYDRSRYDEAWLGRLTQRYAYHVAMDMLAEQGFSVVEEQAAEDRSIHIVVRRMG